MKKLKPSFDDYEMEPSPQVWINIASQLDSSSNKKAGWLVYGIAAALFFAFILFITLFYDVEIKLIPKRITNTASSDETKRSVNKNNFQQNNKSSLHAADQSTGSESSFSLSDKHVTATEANKNSSHHRVSPTVVTAMKPGKNPPGSSSSVREIKEAVGKNETVITSEEARTFVEKIQALDPAIAVEEPSFIIQSSDAMQQDQPVIKKLSVSRWQLLLIPTLEYNYRVINFIEANQAMSEDEKNYFKNEKGIYSFSCGAFCSYSISTHFSIASGINYFKAGQERNRSDVKLISNNMINPADNLYSISSSTGNMNGSSQQFNHAYYSNTDSSLFAIATPFTSPNRNTTATRTFTLREEFYFISIPFLIQYSATEHRFTPYVGFGFSFDFLLNKKILLNDGALDYNYSAGLHSFIPSAEAQAGVKYRLNKHLGIHLQSSLRYGLNSISSNEKTAWIPYACGIGGGLSYRF